MKPDLLPAYRILRRRRRTRAVLLVSALALVLIPAVYLCRVVASIEWNELEMERILNLEQSVIVYDRDGAEVVTLHTSEDRIRVSLSDVPKYTRDAFVSAEDARFYEHCGIDVIRIFGALWADVKAGAFVQGASTITQQLIKLSHLTSEKQLSRKIEEAVLACRLEQRCDKDEILEMYLNYVYFGGGYYGIEAAARGYFGVSAKQLTVAQSALLAGVLKSPSRFAPHLDAEASVGRRNVVLSLMAEYGYIDAAECALAQAEELTLTTGAGAGKRGAYVDLALTEACEKLEVSMDALLSGGYRVYTAMDCGLQKACDAVFENDAFFPSADMAETEASAPQAALAVVDVKTGGVVCIRGGRNDSVALGYNRAVRIRRQPGSVIKPILVYAPALEHGFTAATMLLDEETDFNGYRPSNSNGNYAGWVTMREAVTRSLNIPAAAVLNEIGVETGKAFARRVGISFDIRDQSLALALGGFTYGVSPLQIAAAYAAFGNGGVFNAPYTVEKVLDASGTVLYQHKAEPVRVMREANAYVLTSMLQSVIAAGTGKRLSMKEIPLAGKTGTTGVGEKNRDAWMAAYNPGYAAAVWIGFDDDHNGRALDENVTGGTFPALILKELFLYLYAESDAPDFVMPQGVREYRIDRRTLSAEHAAVLANALTPDAESYSEVFVVGTEPEQMTSYWQIPVPPTRITVTANEKTALVYFETPSRYMLYRLYRENEAGIAVLVGEFSGEGGSVAFTDETIPSAGAYGYYVIPVHPRLEVAGQLVVGEPSSVVSVRIW